MSQASRPDQSPRADLPTPALAADPPMAIPLPPVQITAGLPAGLPEDSSSAREHRSPRWMRWSVAATAGLGVAMLVVVFGVLLIESPRLVPPRDLVVKAGQTARATAELEDPQAWQGKVHFSLADDAPAGAAIDPTTGEFSWTPTADQAGRIHQITLRVARSETSRSPREQTLRVRVNPNEPPRLDPPLVPDVIKVGDQVAFRVRGRDTDEPPSPLRYALVGDHNPPAAALDPTTGKFWWAVAPPDNGEVYRLAVEATEQDAQLLRATCTSILRVRRRMPVGYGLTAQYYADHEWKQPLIERFDSQIDFLWAAGPPHPDLKADDFAVRWTGWLRPPAPGEYRLVAVSDDGLRVFLDDRAVIDDWGAGPIRRRETNVTLSNKPHALRVEYRDHKDVSAVSLRWVRPSGPPAAEPVPPQCLFCVRETADQAEVKLPPPRRLPAALGPNAGLDAEYSSGTNFERSIDRRVEPRIDHLWGLDKPLERLPADTYSVRWTGRLTPLLPGKYKIVAYSDEGLRVWIDEKPIIDNWKRHPLARNEAEVELSDRPHKLRVEYFDDDHAAVASLRWILPGEVDEQVIPAWVYSRDVR